MNEQAEVAVLPLVRAPKKSSRDALANDPRPTIRLAAGEIERIVDEAEFALIKANRGLYQRDNKIVVVAAAPAKAAHGREIMSLRVFERGDHALLEDLATSANFEKFDKRARGYVVADPPMTIVKTMQERIGKLRLPILSGVISAPTMRSDGSILGDPGYDAATGLLFDPRGVTFPPIADRPTHDDARKAFRLLCEPIKDFPFVQPHDRSVALSAMLTACVRRTLPTAPLFGFTAPIAGSGKSKLVDVVSVIATGHEAPVIAAGATDEELEKRLGSMLLAGNLIIAIDNVDKPLGGELLCQALTQTRVQIRILGVSKTPELSTSALVAATGNNLLIRGDLTRRTMMCRLDPQMEQPERRVFDCDPVDIAKATRPDLVVAALIILRAHHMAGRPGAPAAKLGSFEAWSDLVRGALLWTGAADPVDSMNELRRSDPVIESIRALMSQWLAIIGVENVTAADVVRRAIETRPDRGGGEFVHPDFREALLAISGKGGTINSGRLGAWLTDKKDRIVDGLCFVKMGDRQGVALWALKASR